MSKTEYILNVNGKSKNIVSSEDKPLLYILRDDFKLTGTKLGCGLEPVSYTHLTLPTSYAV